ncbi:MAG: VOC family protein [Alphaproteobacteria bacterium]|uniref:VOC family protein n=1 Tax=Maricaulis alexandrii TaxID=2570354 RepID=UPI001F215D8A|nr:VOC family protein [Maricaulis alexandrii]MCR9266074.1 VOC family protein [Alphaproteobacteria bacterium]
MSTKMDDPVAQTQQVSLEMRVVPYLSVDDGAAALTFYETAFGAEVLERYEHEGKLGHATLRINGGILMLADEFPDPDDLIGNVSPKTLGGRTTSTINLNVDDAQAWFERATAAGAKTLRPLTQEFFGRHGKLRDPFGHVWSVVELKR